MISYTFILVTVALGVNPSSRKRSDVKNFHLDFLISSAPAPECVESDIIVR